MRHAVATEPVIVRIARRELRIRSVAIERTAKVLRHLAPDRKIGRVGFEGDRREMADEERVRREWLAHGSVHPRMIIWGSSL